MDHFILTGAPGAGKTTIAKGLADLGIDTVEEGFMSHYRRLRSEGWSDPFAYEDFFPELIEMQLQAQHNALQRESAVKFFDRSVLCTLALVTFMGREPGPRLVEAAEEMRHGETFSRDVLLVQGLGWLVSDDIRTLSYADAERFSELHRTIYTEHGFNCREIPPLSPADRVQYVLSTCGLQVHQ